MNFPVGAIFSYDLTTSEFVVLGVVAFLIGMSKTGIGGLGMIAVPLLAIVFGGRSSSGIMLPMLIFADFFGVRYYHQHARWNHLTALLPAAFAGVLLGTWIGGQIDDLSFRQIMAAVVFISLGIMIYLEDQGKRVLNLGRWFAVILGIAGGFTTMVGNLAGTIMALYLLAMGLPKNQFIGTAAWFFLCINVVKVPFHIIFWKTITWESLMLNVLVIPFIAMGAVAGVRVVRKISDQNYRWFILVITAIASVFMIF